MIIQGPQIAAEILAQARARVEAYGRTPTVRAITIAPTPATESYLRIKQARASDAGMVLEVVRLSESASIDDAIAAVKKPGADAIIIQLPLPAHIDTESVLNSVPRERDADVLSKEALERFIHDEEGALLPPVVAAIEEIIDRTNVEVEDARAAVVGNGRLVGAPAAVWLRRHGAEVTTIVEDDGEEALAQLAEAHIIISGAGHAGLITPELISPGAVLIDAGTSEQGGTLAGDVDPACEAIASVFTPVPGGVGPIAVACLFRNVSYLLEG